MQKQHVIIWAFSIFCLIPTKSFGSLGNIIENISEDGTFYNHNAPSIIKDQQGGYLSAGSLILKGPRPKELSPIRIRTPKLSYDPCTGSGDFRFGAMSYISGEEFSRFLKNVARASGAYLVKMSIKTACPQCEDIMTYLETVARDINNLSLNQCSMSQMIASSAFSRLVSSDKQLCMMDSNFNHTNQDMFETTKNCQDSANVSRISKTDEFGDQFQNDFNLVWKALKGSEGGTGNFKELMMSISGTIIVRKKEGRYVFDYLPSLVMEKDLLEKYIGGNQGVSKIHQYMCDSKEKCLEPKTQEVSLSSKQTIYGNIARILRSIIGKVRADDDQFDDEENALLSFSSIPILNLIEIELASKAREHDLLVRVSEFIDAICADIMSNYMNIIISNVISRVKNIRHSQSNDQIIDHFIHDCEYVSKYLRDAKFTTFQKLQLIMQVKERIANQSREFEMYFARLIKTYN